MVVFAAMKTTTMRTSAVEASEVGRRCQAAEVGRMSELMVFPRMMDHEGVSAIPSCPIPTREY
jgi:hypothetical protein